MLTDRSVLIVIDGYEKSLCRSKKRSIIGIVGFILVFGSVEPSNGVSMSTLTTPQKKLIAPEVDQTSLVRPSNVPIDITKEPKVLLQKMSDLKNSD